MSFSSVNSTLVHAASVVICAGVLHCNTEQHILKQKAHTVSVKQGMLLAQWWRKL